MSVLRGFGLLNSTKSCLVKSYFFFFKDLFLLIFIGKADIQRGDTERKIFRPMIHSPSERNGQYYAHPQSGASSRSPTQVQGPKALGCPRLLSRATGRELEGKRGCRDRTGAHMGSRVCKARTFNHLRHCAGPPQYALSYMQSPMSKTLCYYSLCDWLVAHNIPDSLYFRQ